jgi:hypothetical protein
MHSQCHNFDGLVWFVMFYATLNHISVIPWRSVLLKPEYPEKSTNQSHVTDKLYHIMLYTSPWSRFELTTLVVIGTDCIGSCKSNYHAITATTLKQEFITWIFLSEMKVFLQSADFLFIFCQTVTIMNDFGAL